MVSDNRLNTLDKLNQWSDRYMFPLAAIMTPFYIGVTCIQMAVDVDRIASARGDVLFAGEIDSQEIIYAEGATRSKSNQAYSRLEIRYDDVLIQLYDQSDKLTDSNDDFEQYRPAELEEVILEQGSRRWEYTRSEVNDSTMHGLHAGRIFERGDSLYNALMPRILDELRQERQSQLDSIVDIFATQRSDSITYRR